MWKYVYTGTEVLSESRYVAIHIRNQNIICSVIAYGNLNWKVEWGQGPSQ